MKTLSASLTVIITLIFGVPFARADRLTVVASVFPLYDFAREVAGPDADVRTLMPAGVEPHSWEPRPSDIVLLSRADIFLHISGAMEPWISEIAEALKREELLTVEVMDVLGSFTGHDGGKNTGESVHTEDPHFWLDLTQGARAVEIIGELLAGKDPAGRVRYLSRAEVYARRLRDLDLAFLSGLSSCSKTTLVTGGHAAFGHMTRRYGLNQIAVYGVSPDTEPSPRQITSIMKQVRELGVETIFYEEMVSPELAKVLANETGTVLVALNPGANLTAGQWQRGVTFIDLMEENLKMLRKGLSCE